MSKSCCSFSGEDVEVAVRRNVSDDSRNHLAQWRATRRRRCERKVVYTERVRSTVVRRVRNRQLDHVRVRDQLDTSVHVLVFQILIINATKLTFRKTQSLTLVSKAGGCQ